MHKISMNIPRDLRIGIPKIGCGLAGGDWKVVEQIIKEHLSEHDLTIVEYSTTEF